MKKLTILITLLFTSYPLIDTAPSLNLVKIENKTPWDLKIWFEEESWPYKKKNLYVKTKKSIYFASPKQKIERFRIEFKAKGTMYRYSPADPGCIFSYDAPISYTILHFIGGGISDRFGPDFHMYIYHPLRPFDYGRQVKINYTW